MTPKEIAMSTEKTDPAANDVEWLAARYVLDELSPADRELFENRLETDEHACAAVASATILFANLDPILVAGRTAVVQSAGGTSGHRSRQRRGAWSLPLSLAVVGLIAIGLWLPLRSGSQGDPRTTQSPHHAAELLRLWRATDARVELGAEDDTSLDGEITVPSWMIAAVESDARRVNGEEGEEEWEDN